jgi:outer membrane protein TolC
MKLMKFVNIFIIILIYGTSSLFSKEIILSEKDYLLIVGKNHPVAKKAELLSQRGNLEIRKAAGQFDPTIFADYQSKTYKDKSYFDIFSGGLKIPVWYGTDIRLSYESNSGNYINPERYTPKDGLLSAGIELPLGQGLLIDKRRAAFKQAEIFERMTKVEQISLLNDLYLQAVNSYWEWMGAYTKLKLTEQSLNVTKIRYSGVLESFRQGDIAAIDTVESSLQVLNFEFNYQNAQNDFIISTLELSNFLWDENQIPMELNSNVVPDNKFDIDLNQLNRINSFNDKIDSMVAVHPEIMVYDFKLDELDVERSLKLEYLKPKLNLKYDFLNDFMTDNKFRLNDLPSNKFGLNFNMPLFLRTERSDLEIADLKIFEKKLERDNKIYQLKNKIIKSYNDVELLSQQFNTYSKLVKNYETLFDAEQTKFKIGESSMFIINSRENSLLNSKIKQIELLTKFYTKIAILKWNLGIISN